MVILKDDANIRKYSDALDFLFNNTEIKSVVIRFKSDGYVLCLEIRNGKTEIIVYKL